MKYIYEENRWQRDDHHHKNDKKMKATTSRARCRHGKEQQGEIDDKPVADRSYCGHAGNILWVRVVDGVVVPTSYVYE